LCRGGKRGAQNQAFGRSRGGFSTKIHARTNAQGLPIALLLTPGEASDSTAFNDLMAEHDADPEVMLADKGYDSDAIRHEIRARGGSPEIPTRRSRRVQHAVNQTLYATRNRIERFFNKFKNSRRVATRYDQTAASFLGFAKLVSIKIWMRFVHAT
jgi:transposase